MDKGGYAFPVSTIDGFTESGMTLRDWYAGMALQGLISGCYAGNNSGFTVPGNVVAAYEYADAMIAQREGK